jgi:hypothetical protein
MMPGSLEIDGVTVIKQVLPEDEVVSLRRHFDAARGPGARAFDPPADIQRVIGDQGPMGMLATSLATRPVKPVRILLFDKTPEANWGVPWHQDRTIAVKQRHDFEGYGPWTNKDGVLHVEPPVAMLEDMLTLRLFVDDCAWDDGPLEVARGSHGVGRIAAADIRRIVEKSDIFIGAGQAGDVLAMKLLAVHSSKRAESPAHRRVLHVDYASLPLPAPLEWAQH